MPVELDEFETEMRSALDACGCNWAFSALRSLNDLLKDLKDRCQKDPEALLNMNLGDFLNTHDKKINRNNETNYAKDAILRFMIDNLEGIADKATVLSKLNQADSSGTPILHHMINQGSRRSVATLMLSGVDPNIRYESSKTPTAWDVLHSPPAIVAKFSREQMRDLMDFQVYSKLNGNKLISKSSTRWDGIDQDMTFASTVDAIDDFRNPLYLSSYPGIETSTWVALSSTSGLTISVVFQELMDYFPAVRELSPVWKFYEHFRNASIAPADPLLNYREVGYWSTDPLYDRKFRDAPRDSYLERFTTIVFPCLMVNTSQRHQDTRKAYMEMRKALSTNTTGKYSSACNVHLERTLDEMYYPGLSAKGLEARNNDQVISGKYRKQERSAKRVPLLMVPQLWLWRLGHTIVSAHPMQPWDKIYSRPYETISGDPYLLRSPFLDSELGEIIATYIEAFGKEQEIDGERFLPALDIFEQEVVSVLSGADEYIDKSDPGSVSFYKERRLLHTLSDVRSELAMILHVLQQQKEILTSLLKEEGKDEAYFLNNRKYSTDYESNWNRVKNAQSILESYEKKIGKIDGDADRVERAVQSLLELKRTYASVKDAHSSLLISTAVIGFTVVTIIFAPLAFLTALFALNIDGFRKLHVKGKDGVYNSGYMGGIFVSSEVLTIGLSFAAVKVSLSYLKKWDSLDEHAGGGDARDDMGERRKDKGGTKRDNKKTDLEAQGGAANAGK